MASIFGILNDGGILITYPILVLLVVIIVMFIRELRQQNHDKTISLIASIAWFAIAWGYLGRTIGLIGAFDAVAAAGDITPKLLAGGLKMALVGPMVGLITFITARVFIIVLTWKAGS